MKPTILAAAAFFSALGFAAPPLVRREGEDCVGPPCVDICSRGSCSDPGEVCMPWGGCEADYCMGTCFPIEGPGKARLTLRMDDVDGVQLGAGKMLEPRRDYTGPPLKCFSEEQ